MRIEVLTSLYPGPTRPFEGVFAERRWLGMRERGHQVTVTQPLPRTPGPLAVGKWREIHGLPGREDRGGIVVERPRYLHVPRAALANARRFARSGLKAIARRPRPDVVVADYAWPAAAAAPALAAEGIPCVVSGRGSDVLQVAGEAGLGESLAGFLRAAGHWCAVSADLVAAMDRLGGGEGTLVPNGVDLERFAPRDRGQARRRLGAALVGEDPEAPLVLVVGHLIERKDPLLALEAFARGAPAAARAIFLGRGPLEGDLRGAIAARGLEGRVVLPGEVPPDELATFYDACDVLLLTSRREGRPNVVLEALASGRPVVATAAGGTGELLAGLADLLVESRDPGELADRLGRILARPPAPAALRARVEPLSWERSLDALEHCLEDAVGAKR